MTSGWRTIRVFISSTFRDMQAERDHLVRFVFPRLREQLLKRRVHLVDVDLRWGVTSDQDAFELCMDEIDRCRPRFLCTLGGRYGWVPPPKTIEADILDAIISGASPAGPLTPEQQASLRRLYIPEQSAKRYRRREKPQQTSLLAEWNADSALAVDVLQRAKVPAARFSITASEVLYGALEKPDTPAFRYFYFRNPEVTNAIPEPHARTYREPEGSHAMAALAELKQRITGATARTLAAPGEVVEAPLPVFVYPCEWDDRRARIAKLEAFGNRVYADLLASMDAEFGTAPPEQADEFDEENAVMEAFIEGHVERYVTGSRAQVFAELRRHAEGGGGNGYLCVTGEPGTGKSALLAKFCREYAGEQEDGRRVRPDRLVIPHFAGASTASTNIRQVLRRFCHELAKGAGLSEQVPNGFDELRKAFPDFLKKAAAAKRVVILIDALNQLDPSHEAHAMRWLPEALPDNVRFILSTLPGPALKALRARRVRPTELPLPPLEEPDSTAIVDGFLQRFRKTLDKDQRAALLEKPDADKPLYLLTALEELRTLGTYEEITERIRTLPGEIQPLFDWILERLERDPGFCDDEGRPVGQDLVPRYCSYMAVSRSGMAQSELVELIAPADAENQSAADPHGHLAAVQRLLRPYLMQRGELLDFFHGQLREAVQSRYLDDARRLEAHCSLAEYFRGKADPLPDSGWAGKSARALSELPYHQTSGQLWEEVHRTLTDLRFLEAKCTLVDRTTEDGRTAYSGVYRVLEDLRLATEHFPRRGRATRRKAGTSESTGGESFSRQRKRLVLLDETVTRHAGVLARQPELLPSHLHNMLILEGRADSAADDILTSAGTALASRPWLRLSNRLRGGMRTALIQVLSGEGSCSSVCWSPGGSLLASGGYADSAIRIWDAVTGESREVLRGHEGPVLSVAWSPDGSLLASGGMDKTVRVWELGSRGPRAVLKGHEDIVGCVAWSPDSLRLASASDDHTVRLWDARTGEPVSVLGRLFRRAEHIQEALARGDSVIADETGQQEVAAMHVDQGAKLVFEGRYEEAEKEFRRAIEVYPFNATAHGNMAVLRLRQGRPEEAIPWVEKALKLNPSVAGGAQTLEYARKLAGNRKPVVDPMLLQDPGHVDYIRAVAWSPDGATLASAGYDGTVRLWDVRSGATRAVLHCRDYVFGLSWSPGSRRVACACHDTKVWLWNAASAKLETVLEGHEGPVTAVAFSPDGSLLASGGDDLSVRVWHADERKPRLKLEGHTKPVFSVAWSPDGNRLASASGDGAVRVWDPAVQETRVTEGHTRRVWDVAWSPDGSVLASAGDDPGIRLWGADGEQKAMLEGHEGPVFALAWAPDGAHLASAGHDRSIRLWDTATHKATAELEDLPNWVSSMAWSPDGAFLALGDKQGRMCVWDPATRELRELRVGESGMIRTIAWSPDGRTLAASSGDTLKLIDAGSWEARKVIELGTDWSELEKLLDEGIDPSLASHFHDVTQVRMNQVSVLAWSPDSKKLAAGVDDAVQIWDADGTPLSVIRGHTLAVESLEWGPDGSLIASGSRDRSVRLWGPENGDCVAVSHCLSGIVSIRFSPDGRSLWSADDGRATGLRPIPYSFELANIKLRTPLAPAPPVVSRRRPRRAPARPGRSTKQRPTVVRPMSATSTATLAEKLRQAEAAVAKNDWDRAVGLFQELLRQVTPQYREGIRTNLAACLAHRGAERVGAAQKNAEARGYHSDEEVALVKQAVEDLEQAAELGAVIPAQQLETVRRFLRNLTSGGLSYLRKAKEASLRNDWDRAVQHLRSAVKEAGAEEAGTIRQSLAVALANRGIARINSAQKEVKSAGGTVTDGITRQFKKGIDDLEEAAALGSEHAASQLSVAREVYTSLTTGVPPVLARAGNAAQEGNYDEAVRLLWERYQKATGEEKAEIEKLLKICLTKAVEHTGSGVSPPRAAPRPASRKRTIWEVMKGLFWLFWIVVFVLVIIEQYCGK